MVTVVTFILVLGFLVFIHELGHYLAARHVGVKVEVFSIGFPPKMWGKKIGDTDYILSWIPLGGYVKLFGQNMEDENPNDPTNYAAKSIMQRFYILIAGPVMNLAFAFLLMPVVYLMGVDSPKYLKQPAQVQEVQSSSFAEGLGLKSGDEIIQVNNIGVKNWEEVHREMAKIISGDIHFMIDRQGNAVEVIGTFQTLKEKGELGWSPHIEPVVGAFTDNSPAQISGLQSGDRIVSLENEPVTDWKDISMLVQKAHNWQPKNKKSKKEALVDKDSLAEVKEIEAPTAPEPKTLKMEVLRGKETLLFEITPRFNTTSQSFMLGMSLENERQQFTVTQAFQLGTERLLVITKATFSFLGQMIRGNGSLDDLGGPLRIGVVLGDAAKSGMADLFLLMAVISLQLGMFNLFPIPALDGGHIFFLLIEKLHGGPLSVKIRERTQLVGFSLLMFLMLMVTYNDILQIL